MVSDIRMPLYILICFHVCMKKIVHFQCGLCQLDTIVKYYLFPHLHEKILNFQRHIFGLHCILQKRLTDMRFLMANAIPIYLENSLADDDVSDNADIHTNLNPCEITHVSCII